MLTHDIDAINADALAAARFDRVRLKYVPIADRHLVGHVAVDGRGQHALRVAGKSEGTVRQGEQRTAVTGAVEVQVPRGTAMRSVAVPAAPATNSMPA